jgi:Bacteriocin-protection, YdeI or OmpD-Associated/Domain of unknown function (DUF1905)
MRRHRFDAVLGGGVDGDLPAVVLPADVAAAMGGRARIPVTGSINGVPFRGSTMPMGDGTHCVGFRKDTRAQAGRVKPGDIVTIEIERDDAPRTVDIPADLAAALDVDPAVRAAFDGMSYTHRKEYVNAVLDAKRPETRTRRLALAVDAARSRVK